MSIQGKICLTFTLFSLSIGLPIFAELNSDNYTSQDLVATSALKEDLRPFSMDLSTEIMGKAKFDNEKCRKHLDDLEFSMTELDFSAVFYYNERCKEGLLATAAYTYSRIIWENPFFDQSHFDTVSLAIAGFTERAENWLWKGEIRLNADVDYFNINDSLFWDIVLAGRYAYCENLGLNIGFIALTGMKIDRIYPILGVDWKINDSWRLNLVYPTNIALIYTFNEQWSFEVATRSFDERHRVGKAKLPNWKMGLIEYRATGAEFGIHYKSCDGNWLANIHGGEILGGRLKIATRGYHHKKRYDFKNAPYIGGEIAGRF